MAKKGKKPAAQPSKLRKSANTASESTKSGSSKPRRKASTLFLTREEEKKPEGWLASSYNTASKWYTNTTKTKTYTGLNGGVRWLGTKAKKKVWGGVEKPPMEKGLDNARYYYNYVMGTDATTQAKSGKKKQRRGATRTEGSTVETETMTQQTKAPTVHVALEPSSFYETPPVGPPPTHYPAACGSDYPPSSRDSKPNLPPRPPGSWPDMSDEKSHKPRLPDHFHDYHHSQPAPSYQDSSFDRLYNGPTETCSRYAESRPPPARAYRSEYHERPMPPLPHRSGSSWDTDRYGAEEEDYARPPPLPPRPSRPPKDTHRHYSHSQYSRRPSSRDTEYSNNESYYSSPPPRSRSSHRAPPRLPPADWDGHRPSTYPSSHHGRARSVRHASWASGSWDEELPPPYQVTEKHSSWAPESIGGRGHATSDRSTGRQLSTRPSSRVPVTKHSRGPRQLRYQADTEEPPRGRSRTRKASRGPSDRSRSTSVASSQAASRPRRLHSSASAAASRIPKR